MEDDKPNTRKNVMGSPTNPDETLDIVMDKGLTSTGDPRCCSPSHHPWYFVLYFKVRMTSVLTSFYSYFPIRFRFCK